ncbi:single-stranded DNA-binding protein [Candidatus Dojkabacteria bacterium]|nr:single-stranded DNA-binding protein [Candidatus Dojkabacteria bacterium]
MAVFGDLNEAQIIGNITQDLEVRYTTGGSAVVNFSVATNRSYRKQGAEEWTEEVAFHNVVVWGNDAEYLSQRASKGTRIYVKGRLQTRSWDDQDGKKNYRTEIVADRVILLDRYERGSEQPGKGGEPREMAEDKSVKEDPKSGSQNQKPVSTDEIDPDDLPF